MNEPRSRLREMLAGPEMIVAPFVFDCLQAKLAAAAGFDAVYMTGFGTAAARGYPDLGLLTMSEMTANARAISQSVNVPVICDADTGYGNALNVWRTVREYEDAGVAALHIEDQVFPKRCGFRAGKQVIAMEAMVPKVRAPRPQSRHHRAHRRPAAQRMGRRRASRTRLSRRRRRFDFCRRDQNPRRPQVLRRKARRPAADLQRRPAAARRIEEVPVQDHNPHRHDASDVRSDPHDDDRAQAQRQTKHRHQLE